VGKLETVAIFCSQSLPTSTLASHIELKIDTVDKLETVTIYCSHPHLASHIELKMDTVGKLETNYLLSGCGQGL
jgi:hypothetical protein